MRWRRLAAKLVLALATIAIAVPAVARPATADEGWVISSWHSDVQIAADSTVSIIEDIGADFSVPSHGIFRTIPIRYRYDQTHDRFVVITVTSVTDGQNAVPFTTSTSDSSELIKIGDPDKLVTGAQRYVVSYTVAGALNSFPDHDELYWNVDSPASPVAKLSVSATVHAPAGGLQDVVCYQGPVGSTGRCTAVVNGDIATFQSRGSVAATEVMSVAVALKKGAVAVPAPFLENRLRRFPQDAFDVTPLTIVFTLLVLVIGLGYVARSWWVHGRDREYLTQYYLANDARERTEPLFHHDVIAVEFEPPQHLRPAQLGLILDESADTKDVTATIVDLAVRGYLKITEIPAQGIFSKKDYLLTWKGAADMKALEPYEQTILEGLFGGLKERKLSELKGKFKPSLDKAEDQIYADATKRKFFTVDPKHARMLWMGGGATVAVIGGFVCWGAGTWLGLGLPGAAVILVGIVLTVFGYFMPQRSAAGRQLLHQTLGFRLYMTTAERYRQQFAEKAQIFTQLLPYAIVFGCVTQWARAFEGIDTSAADGWYVGPGPFQAILLATTLESFNSTLSTTIASTPAGSGVSGFAGGGFSGGGFGGGGIGRW